MICTNTDHYVNTLSTIKKEKKKKKEIFKWNLLSPSPSAISYAISPPKLAAIPVILRRRILNRYRVLFLS